jgi:two-component system, cell cycle sensor histidine kinase and response regulator CckA
MNAVDAYAPHANNGPVGSTPPGRDQEVPGSDWTRALVRRHSLGGTAFAMQPSDSAVWTSAVRLFLGVMLANVVVALVWFLLSTIGVISPGDLSSWVRMLVTGLADVAAAYVVCVYPICDQLSHSHRRIVQYGKFKQELEERLKGRESELTSTKAQLESEIAQREKSEAAARELTQTLEQRLSEQVSQLQKAVSVLRSDLAETQRSEAELRRSEKHSRQLLEHANHGMWTINAQGETTFMNRHGAELLGYAASEVIGRTPRDFIVAEDLSKLLDGTSARPGSEAGEGELRMRRKDGSTFWIRASVSLLLGDGDDYVGSLIVFADSTSRKKADDSVRARAAFFDFAQDAVVVCDESLHILAWSKGAARLYGWAPDDVLGRPVFELLSDSKAASDAQPILRALRAQEHWRGEYNHVTKLGRTVTVDVRLTFCPSTVEKLGSILFVATDVSQRDAELKRTLRDQRMEAVRAFALGLGREFTNVLSPVVACAQTLSARQLGPEDQRLLVTIQTSADRGTQLLNQTLFFARGVETQRDTVSAAAVLREIVDITREVFPPTFQVFADIQSDLWSVKGDAGQLRQLLLKLAVHAREAMPTGGTLSLRAKNFQPADIVRGPNAPLDGAPCVVLQVEDTGPAVPAVDRDKVFEPFFVPSGRRCGAGLSLAMAQSSVRSLGGTIEVQSLRETGATVSVMLPAVSAPSDPGASPKSDLASRVVARGS